jgi:hypothetical protein
MQLVSAILCMCLAFQVPVRSLVPVKALVPVGTGQPPKLPTIVGTPVGTASYGIGTTVNYSPAAGNSLIVLIGCESSTYCPPANPPAAVRLQGSSTAALTQDSAVGWTYASSYVYRYQSVPAGITGVLLVWNNPVYYSIVVIEASGLAASPVDVVDATGNTGSGTTWTTGTMAGVTAGDLVIGMLHSSAASSAPSVSIPWSGASFGNASYQEAIYSYQVVGSGGSYAPAATGPAVAWYAAGIAYK